MSRLALMLAVILALSGCVRRDEAESQESSNEMDTLIDHDTGCQYLGYGRRWNGKALTPRIAADGKTHMGCKE